MEMPTKAALVRIFWTTFVLAALVCVCLLQSGCRRELTELEKARQEVAKDPRSAKAQLALGKLLFQRNAFNDAFAAFSEARRLDPKNVEAAYELARTNLALADVERGIQAARDAIALDPRHAPSYEVLGRLLLQKGDYSQAEEVFNRAIQYDPKRVDARIGLMWAKLMLGQRKEAMAAAKEAMRIAPKDPRARLFFAEFLKETGDIRGAEREYREAVRLDPKDPVALLRLSLLLIGEERNFEEARNLARQAAEIDAMDGTPAAVAAWALHRMGKTTDAQLEFRGVCESFPHNYRAWLLFSRALKEEGLDRPAELALKEALRVAPRVRLSPEERKRLAELTKKRSAASGRRAEVYPISPRDLFQSGVLPPPTRKETTTGRLTPAPRGSAGP